MSQTSYSRVFVNAFAGMLGDSGFRYIQTRVNASGVDLPAAIGVKESDTDDSATVLAASSDVISGVIVNSFARDPGSAGNSLSGTNAIKAGNEMNILSEGVIFVKPEQTCTVSDPVYVRYATSVNDSTLTQTGSFRKDADLSGAVSGTANVVTVTPTAVDGTVYVLRVEYGAKVWEFEAVAQTSSTATTISTQFRTLMAADAEFTALIVASGTATLILTAQDKTSAITAHSEGDGALAVANTTPYVAPSAGSATARQVKAARWLHNQGTSGVQAMYISAALDKAMLS